MAQARYKHLVYALAADIRAGRLAPGTRLPTHRKLAAQEGLALVTASRVYAELEAMGLVSGETGRGTFVRETFLPRGLGVDQQAVAPGVVDLNFNYPSLPGQADLLRDGLRQLAASGDLEALLRYQPHAGRPHERAIVARHLVARGLEVDAGHVLIVDGAQHGLATTVMALLQPGDVVAVDALTYPGFKVLAEAQQLELAAVAEAGYRSGSTQVAAGSRLEAESMSTAARRPGSTQIRRREPAPVPAAGQGMDLDALERLCASRRVRAVYAMPTLHNPLGHVMPASQRRRLVAIARRHDLLIIEDAAYAFLADDPPAPLAALAPERTVYVSGLSKSVATGLRVGFIAAPLAWVPKLERAIRATTWNTPGVMTALACAWLEDGTVTRLEAEKRRDARQRQAIAATAFAGLRCIAHPTSYFVWLPLGEDARADLLAMALMRERIAVSTAEAFATSSHPPHAIRVALGSVALTALGDVLRRVRAAIDEHVLR